jgi:hypothetical protein
MEASMRLIAIALLGLASAAAQTPSAAQPQQEAANTQPQMAQQQEPGNWVTVPAGTKVLLVLKNSISSKNAKKGDGVYLESSFPITQDGLIVIPAGTFVQGVIDEVKRPGRVKGRGEILMHFTSLVYPNGYSVTLPSSGVESTDSSDSQTVADKEGTVKGGGSKGRDAATVATTTATGAGIGAAAGGWKGAGIGSGIGVAAGLGAVLLTRGEEVRLYQGTTIEMVLNRPLKLDATRIDPSDRHHFVPVRELQQRQRQRLMVPPTIGEGPIVR